MNGWKTSLHFVARPPGRCELLVSGSVNTTNPAFSYELFSILRMRVGSKSHSDRCYIQCPCSWGKLPNIQPYSLPNYPVGPLCNSSQNCHCCDFHGMLHCPRSPNPCYQTNWMWWWSLGLLWGYKHLHLQVLWMMDQSSPTKLWLM